MQDDPRERDRATLVALGWDDTFEAALEGDERLHLPVARVIEEQKRFYFVEGSAGIMLARIAGKLRHAAIDRAGLPAVGDFVVVAAEASGEARIERVLPRRTKLSRKAAGEAHEEQILCTNVDVAFLVTAFGADLNLRRLERYLAMVRAGGAAPVVVLTKADLAGDVAAAVADVTALAQGAPVLATSVPQRLGVEALAAFLAPGRTAVLLGSSGVGKSTLINALAGADLRAVADVRAVDQKGRHTTTARTLVKLPAGGLIIDTPGIRELELWEAEPTLADTFDDIAAFAAACRFRDCTHRQEPGCAVRDALADGTLPAERYESFLKLRAEAVAQEKRLDARARAEESRRAKVAQRALRARLREKS